MGFKNRFLSVRGQVERLKNVAGVLTAPFTGGRVYGNTPSNVLDKVVEVVSNNPFKTAIVAGTVANIPKAVRLAKRSGGSQRESMLERKRARRAEQDKPGVIEPTPTAQANPGTIETKTSQVDNPGVVTTATRKSPVRRKTTRPRARARTRRAKPRSRKSRKSSPRRKSKKRRVGTAKQYARKGGKSVKYAKNGTPYIIMANGRSRFIKGKRK